MSAQQLMVHNERKGWPGELKPWILRGKVLYLCRYCKASGMHFYHFRFRFLIAFMAVLSVPGANAAWTRTWGETLSVGDHRYIANKVSNGDQVSGENFQGYVDVWSNSKGSVFATNIKCNKGQAWPRILEGSSESLYDTPGYPINVDDFIGLSGGRYISYSGQWVDRSHGPKIQPKSASNLQSGAYMWLDNIPANNLWPYKVEINIWNTHLGGFPPGAQSLPDYADSNGKYKVAWKDNYPFSGGQFRSYYFNLDGSQTADMVINAQALLQHLKDSHNLDGRYFIVEIDVAAEAYPGGDGKFIAEISTMGRP